MSAYSTIHITRRKAMELVLQKLADMDDDTLKRWTNDVIEPHLYNCFIVDNDEENDDHLV